MKVNNDTVAGFFVGILVIGLVVWGAWITMKVNRVAVAHDNLVAVLSNPPRQQMPRQVPAPSAMPAPVQPEVKK